MRRQGEEKRRASASEGSPSHDQQTGRCREVAREIRERDCMRYLCEEEEDDLHAGHLAEEAQRPEDSQQAEDCRGGSGREAAGERQTQ